MWCSGLGSQIRGHVKHTLSLFPSLSISLCISQPSSYIDGEVEFIPFIIGAASTSYRKGDERKNDKKNPLRALLVFLLASSPASHFLSHSYLHSYNTRMHTTPTHTTTVSYCFSSPFSSRLLSSLTETPHFAEAPVWWIVPQDDLRAVGVQRPSLPVTGRG